MEVRLKRPGVAALPIASIPMSLLISALAALAALVSLILLAWPALSPTATEDNRGRQPPGDA